MYRAAKDSRYPFSRPSGTAHTAIAGATAVVVVLAIIVACGRTRTPQPTANGSGGTRSTADAALATPTSVSPPVPATPTVPADVSYETAESAYAAHHYPLAVAMFEAYTARRPDNPWGQYMMGLSSWHAGQLDRAQQAFETALNRDPRHVKSLVNLTRVLLEEHKSAEALDRINQALAIDSGLGETWRVLGRVQAQAGHTDAAVDAYRTAIKLDSTDVWAMNNLGLVLINAGRYAEAVEPLARAVQLDSSVPTFNNNLGLALERNGHYTAAAVAYRSALSADSGYDKARVSLQRVDGGAKKDRDE
jgi:predicted Zn-dependent protease